MKGESKSPEHSRDQMFLKRIAKLERDKENLLGICGDPKDKLRIAELESRIRERDKDIAELVVLREREAFYEGMRKDMSNKQQRIAELEHDNSRYVEINSEICDENHKLRAALETIAFHEVDSMHTHAQKLDSIYEIAQQALKESSDA